MSDPLRPTACSAVDEHIAKPIPSILWHYTSFAGLQGIVSSKTIWATEYRFLNDREEFQHARTQALSVVEEEPEFTGEGFPARDMIRKAINIALNTGSLHEERLRIMVASFSENGDQLSQWGKYASAGTGVSIGLDMRRIRPPSDIGTTVTFAPCLYRDADKRSILKAVVAQYRSTIQKWWDSLVKMVRHDQIEAARQDPEFAWKLIEGHSGEQRQVLAQGHTELQFNLLRIAPLLKHEGFSEEREWRLVLPIEAIRLPSRHPFQFRATPNTLVPYIAYPLNKENQEGPITCRSVIVGPGGHESAEVAVNIFLLTEQIPLQASRSEIPYRPPTR